MADAKKEWNKRGVFVGLTPKWAREADAKPKPTGKANIKNWTDDELWAGVARQEGLIAETSPRTWLAPDYSGPARDSLRNIQAERNFRRAKAKKKGGK